FDDETLYFGEIGNFTKRIGAGTTLGRKLQVPAFDPDTGRMALRDVSAVIKHPSQTEMYEIRTRYGRVVRVTGDHSVFRRGAKALPEATPVRDLRVGDDIAIPSSLPVVERDLPELCVSRHLLERCDIDALWEYAACSPAFADVIARRREEIHRFLGESGRFN